MNPSFPILIADNDDAHIQRLGTALRSVGFNNPFHVSRDGNDVMKYLRGTSPYEDREKHRFPCMLLLGPQLEAPGAMTVLAWLKEHEECNVIPRVIFADTRDQHCVQRAYQLGVNTFFVKPPTQAGLENLLRVLLDYWDLAELPTLPAKC